MDDEMPSVGQLAPEWVDFFVVFGAIALVLLFVFFWALFIRKRKGVRRGKRRRRHENSREQFQKNAGGIKELLHKEMPRRANRAANPTLAQAGGLPPLREENKSDRTTPPP